MSTPKRLRVLWLCSWYPSAVDPFSGDFIQRHAEAVSEHADLHVLHAIGGPARTALSVQRTERNPHLQEWVAYYPIKRMDQRWLSSFQWLRMMWQMIRRYRATVGLPDLVHVQIPYKSGLIARYLLYRYRIPYVVTEHWGIYQEQTPDRFGHRSFLFRLITRLGYEKAARSISVSDYQSQQLQTYLSPLPSQTIYNAVDTRFFQLVDQAPRPFTFLHVSDWSENKNPAGIIRAFCQIRVEFPDARLILVGGKGVRRHSICRLVQSIGACIQCEGEVSYESVARFMQQADCLVLNSYMENSPCVIGEALCTGLSVIATKVGGVAELVDPVCSELIPADNEPALYQAMQDMIQKSRGISREAVALRAQARFSYAVVGRQLDETYRSVLGLGIVN